MKNINEITLLGTVITDPQVILETPLGVRFRIKTTEVYFNKDSKEKVQSVEIHNIKCWKNIATYTLNNIKKGNRVLIKGRLHNHRYVTEDGKNGVNPEIITNHIIKEDNNITE